MRLSTFSPQVVGAFEARKRPLVFWFLGDNGPEVPARCPLHAIDVTCLTLNARREDYLGLVEVVTRPGFDATVAKAAVSYRGSQDAARENLATASWRTGPRTWA